MKRTLSLLLACSFGLLPSAFAVEVGETVNLNNSTVITDGINVTFSGQYTSVWPKKSTRFYDSKKGRFWTDDYTYSDETEGDSLMCWSHVSSNLIQYWQSYYGVFYKGDKANLPYGSAPGYVISGSTTPDPKVLNVAKNIFETWRAQLGSQGNTGGKLNDATDYFFASTNLNGTTVGGYYKEYFGSSATQSVSTVSNISNLTQAILPAFGIDAASGEKTEMGLMPYIGLSYDKDGYTYGHTVTCYGFTTDENGQISSLIMTNPDDTGTTMTKAYIKEVNGQLLMYRDEAYTKRWNFNSSNKFYISSVSHIETPEVLQNMLAEYSDMEEALVWNGAENGEWKTQAATTEALPTTATGWDVLVDGDNIDTQHRDYYNSYAADNRDVRFDSHASSQEVTIVGTVTPGNIEIAEGNYVFTADADAAIAGSGDVMIRSGASLNTSVDFGTRNIKLEAGATLSSDSAIAVKGEFHSLAAMQQAATFSLREATTPTATVKAGLDLREATALTMEAEVDMTEHDLFLSDKPVTLTMTLNPGTKNILFSNIGTLYIGNTAIANGFSASAAQYFTTTTEDLTQFYLVYNNNTVSLQTFIEGDAVPEPTSATLSLMALTALAARRRRRK